jgi:catechol 2,3-dioxygenase-like lactoylglutathione lyase family enzyme
MNAEMPKSAPQQSPMEGRKSVFSHMGVSCLDLKKMEDFYTRVMGMTVSDRGLAGPNKDRPILFLTSESYDHHQLVLASGRTEGEMHDTQVIGGSFGTAIFQISFKVDSLATLRAYYKRLQEDGNTNLTPRNHGNAWALYTRDVEGNGLELFVDTPWFTHQPCGEFLDLSKSDEEIYKYTEELCRQRPDFAPVDDYRARMKDAILKVQSRLF